MANSAHSAELFVSSPAQAWVRTELRSAEKDPLPPAAIRFDLEATKPDQRMEGFGGCFNEKGWEVLGLLDRAEAGRILDLLFTPGKGCGFNLGRLPMGANDYSLEWYSFDETPGDLQLKHFSIDRDRGILIPYLREALGRNAALQLWASPWCPPSWMKTNGHYAGLPAAVNDLKPEQAGTEMVTQFRMEPEVLSAYADYFCRFISAYRGEGLLISAVHVQNEPNSCQNFPSCVWRPEDLATFVSGYLGPRLRATEPATSLWLGTVERPQLERVTSILDSAAGSYIAGVGMQWAGKGVVAELHRTRPLLPLMQTESECGDGSNDWAAARHTWGLMHHYLTNGAVAYMYWNLVLDETGNSHWGWRQNALVTVDRQTRQARLNPEFYLMMHFSRFIQRGARFLRFSGEAGEALAFANPDGRRVLVLSNPAQAPLALRVTLSGKVYPLVLPPLSFATLVE